MSPHIPESSVKAPWKLLHFGKIPKKIGQNLAKLSKILANLQIVCKKAAWNLAMLNEIFDIRERCKGVHCVDLGESFPTSIYLQNLASIQPRTSPSKFGGYHSIVSEERRVAPPAAATIWTWQFRNIWIWQFRSICKKRVGKSIRGNPKLAPDVAPQRVRSRLRPKCAWPCN